MLTAKIIKRNIIRKLTACLFCILMLAKSSHVFAESKEQLGEEYRLQGLQEKQNGNYNEALSLYIKAVALGVVNPAVYNDMGVLYEEIGFDNRAEAAYLKSIQTNKDYLPAYSNLALFYQRLGKNELAFNFFRKRFELSKANDLWAQKAKDEMLKLRPEYRSELLKKEALDFQNDIVQKNQEEFAMQIQLAAQHFLRGKEYNSAGQYREAINEFNQSLSINPRNQQVLKARKQALLELSKQNMQMQYQKAIDLMSAGNTRSAKQQVQRMLSTIPNE